MIPTTGIAVDGSCCPNPGLGQWRGVDLETNQQLFCSHRYDGCTNNIAEYLAIVHALAFNPKSTGPIYTDSQTAIAWIKKGYCLTTLGHSDQIRQLIIRANKYISENPVDQSRIKFWSKRTLNQENPADFGRK